MKVIKIREPSAKELVREFAVELIGTIPKCVVPVEIRYTLCRNRSIRMWVGVYDRLPDRIDVRDFAIRVVPTCRDVFDTSAANAGARSADRADLREVSGAFQLGRHDELCTVDVW